MEVRHEDIKPILEGVARIFQYDGNNAHIKAEELFDKLVPLTPRVDKVAACAILRGIAIYSLQLTKEMEWDMNVVNVDEVLKVEQDKSNTKNDVE